MRIKDGFEITQVSDSVFVASATGDRAKEFPDGVQMGLSGAFLWDLMTKQDCDRTQLIFSLENFFEYDIPAERLAEDVDVFVNFLKAGGYLVEE